MAKIETPAHQIKAVMKIIKRKLANANITIFLATVNGDGMLVNEG